MSYKAMPYNKNPFPMYHYYMYHTSPFHPRMLCAKFGWICPCCIGDKRSKMKMWEVYIQTDDQKSSLELSAHVS